MQALLSTSRMAVSLGFLLIPGKLAPLFGIPFTPEAAVVSRMTGARDLILGVLLYTCRSRASAIALPTGKTGADSPTTATTPNDQAAGWTDTERALLAGIAVDALDMLSFLWCYWDGTLPGTAALVLGGGADVFLSLGLYCWYLQAKEKGRGRLV